MKISIFTPTHDTRHMKELEESVLNNTYQNWEWVVLLNNGAAYTAADDRIKIIKSTQQTKSVGALKREACSHCNGEILVEVDHDDMITPDCLEEIATAFATDHSVGFVTSDNAKLGDFTPYHEVYGWSYRMYEWQGRPLYAMYNQPLYPGRLGYIWYAPDHVRAWRRDVYEAIGGHNPEFDVCDDHDLIIRTYYTTAFKYIEKVLYIYRIDGKNTWLQRNEKIQSKTVELYHSNIYALAHRFADINGLDKIDLCSGHNKPAGYIGIDKINGDIIADLDQGIPLADNSVGVIRAHDAIEHLRDPIKTMREIHRVLAPGGMLLSLTPSTDGRGAWQDPTHVSFWNENSFWYYTRPEQMKYIGNTSIKFRECSLGTIYPGDWHRNNNIAYVRAHLEKLP